MNPKVELKRTQLHTIHSKINFQKYDLYFRLPNGYDQRSPDDKYDALFILNGQWDFGLMLSVYGSANFDKLLPNIILVGIAWNGQETDEEARAYSIRDYGVSVEGGAIKGGAFAFANILENEIVPYVESNFAANGNRCLSGSSVAAWFGLFTMFSKPSLFKKYVLSSPPTDFASGFLFHLESKFSQTNSVIDANVYVCYGDLEDNINIKKFMEILEGRGYKKFRLHTEEIKNTGHAANKPIGYTKGLIHLYKEE